MFLKRFHGSIMLQIMEGEVLQPRSPRLRSANILAHKSRRQLRKSVLMYIAKCIIRTC